MALPADEAIELFTPEGERAWAPGWDPSFPAGQNPDEGAVFVTGAHGPTCWIVLAREPRRMAYARVQPGVSAGTVSVTCVEEAAERSAFEVAYDLTALGDEGDARLAELERGYAAEIAGWGDAIARALAS